MSLKLEIRNYRIFTCERTEESVSVIKIKYCIILQYGKLVLSFNVIAFLTLCILILIAVVSLGR